MTRFVGHGRAEVTPASELTGVDEHLRTVLSLLPDNLEAIELRLADALGLVLAEDVTSHVSLPAFANAAMDGYAVVSTDLLNAAQDNPVHLPVIGEIAAGATDLPQITRGRCVSIMTGAPIPPGADAVVPVETTAGGGGQVTFFRPVEPWAHVRHPGEDLSPGQPLISAGRRLAPAEIGLLAAAGISRVVCVPSPRVVVLSSGDELVPAADEPGPGSIRDSNGPMLAAMVRAAGGVPFSAGIARDDRRALMYAFDTNVGHADLFLVTGGASAGTRDLIPDVIANLGEVVTAKVAMKPGMPQIAGRIAGVPVIGLPGNPVSAFVSFEVFVRPAIRRLQGRRDVQRPVVVARATEPLTAPPHKRGYVRVRLDRDDQGWLAAPTGPQGSHVITSIARADGLAVVPEAVTEIPQGGEVQVNLVVE